MGGLFKSAGKGAKNVGKGAKHAFLGQDKRYQMDLQTKQQQKDFSKLLSNLNPRDFSKAYETMLRAPKEDIRAYSEGVGNFLNTNEKAYSKPFMKGIESFINPSTSDMMKSFQTGVVNPTLDIFNKQIKPGIQEDFTAQGAGYSSALNDALAMAGKDVATHIGSQLPSFLQNQQQNKLASLGLLPGMINQGQNTRLNALNMIPGARSNFYGPMQNALSGYQAALGEQTFQPVLSNQQGILSSKEGGQGLAAVINALSSREVKENIKDYDKGLSEIDKMEVKSYDYINGEKNRIGIIAEDAPEEIRTKLQGINAVDLYGMVSLLVNAVKELSSKVEALEARS